jgi:glutathione S-transferase/alpha,alpha-trehalase
MQPNRALDQLERILSGSDWLVDNTFSVADVAVASYLNYVPLFFRNVKPSSRPQTVRYMRRCAERPAFAAAFSAEHASQVQAFAALWT